MLTTEYDAIDSAILSLEKILGRDTVECFTGGTHDIELLIPLIEFMTPYIQKSRTEKVEKYIGHSNDNDVME